MARLPNDDYDGAWKAALGVYLQEFLALCFPAIYAAIDWTRSYRFLGFLYKPSVLSRHTVSLHVIVYFAVLRGYAKTPYHA